MNYVQRLEEIERREPWPWDDKRASERRATLFKWAAIYTPTGTWERATTHRPGLRSEMDAALDAISAAFGERDTYTLSLALVRFRGVIYRVIEAAQAVEHTQARTPPQMEEAIA